MLTTKSDRKHFASERYRAVAEFFDTRSTLCAESIHGQFQNGNLRTVDTSICTPLPCMGIHPRFEFSSGMQKFRIFSEKELASRFSLWVMSSDREAAGGSVVTSSSSFSTDLHSWCQAPRKTLQLSQFRMQGSSQSFWPVSDRSLSHFSFLLTQTEMIGDLSHC